MANSSPPPPRRAAAATPSSARPLSFRLASPPEIPDFLSDTRNSPEAHRRNYEVAQREHRRVLDAALHVYELHQLSEAARQIEEEEQRRKERVAEEAKRIEKERQAKIKQLEDEARLAAQKAAPLPKPVVLPPPPPPPAPPTAAPAAVTAAPKSALPISSFLQQAKPPAQQINGTGVSPGASKPAQPQAQPVPSPVPPKVAQAPTISVPNVQQTTPQNTAGSTAKPAAQTGLPAPEDDRHIQVHKNLKQLRKFVKEQATTNAVLKKRMGDMRRDIRKSFGQLTSGGLRENRVPVARLITTLQAGLKEVPSELMDPNLFVLEPRNTPVDGASHNEAQLPSLYLYLLNIMAKAAISQFINESGADTRTAEAIGQTVVKVYSENEFLWRGKPMIDMLIAKYRVFCPVLFGFRGDDRTESGRAQVGWRKENGHWIPEQYHIDRMTGLGAGFAAMTLRDFSRVKRPNPWPPTVYWTALAKIINTPPAEMSETQCYVLKAMIADNEPRFMSFYGNAAIAALKCALLDYPARKPKATVASETLKVLAKTIHMKTGLDLERI